MAEKKIAPKAPEAKTSSDKKSPATRVTRAARGRKVNYRKVQVARKVQGR